MSKLVDLDAFRREQTVKRSFADWQKRFDETFTFETRLPDLSSHIIGILAEPGEKSASIYYELIMGVLDLGHLPRFEFLQPAERLRVVDTHLFLADLVRYEMMQRIGWIDDYSDRDRSLIDLIESYESSDYSRYSNPPQLSRCHPQFDDFNQRITREKEVMLRQLHQEALEAFRSRFGL